MNSKLRLALLPLLAAFTLAAPVQAADTWSGGAQARSAMTRPGWDDLEHAKWIADGRDDAPHRVYVFMDANCGYCTKLWAISRPWIDAGQVQLRYLMVGVISPSSAGKAATILADPRPAARLYAYERAHALGPKARVMGNPEVDALDPIPPALAHVLDEHQRMMTAFAMQGTPGIVYRTSDGQMVTRPGLSAEDLPLMFGALQAR